MLRSKFETPSPFSPGSFFGLEVSSPQTHSRTVGVPELRGFAVDGSKGSALGWMKRISREDSLQEIS